MKIKYFLICIFLCVHFLTRANDTICVSLADSLMLAGKFNDAAIEYERAFFITSNQQIKTDVLIKKSYCYKQNGQFHNAHQSLERIKLWSLTDSLHYLIRYQMALLSYLMSEFNEADAQFTKMAFYLKDTLLIIKSLPLQVLVNNELGNWDKSKQLLLKFVNVSYSSVNQRDSLMYLISNLYSNNNMPDMKNTKKAKLLSTLVPGLGQVYAGYPAEGALNFLIHASCLAIGAWGIYLNYYITGYLVGLGLFQKFYFGGINRAVYLVEKRNYKEKLRFNSSVKDFLLNNSYMK